MAEETRRETYERRKAELEKNCERCRKLQQHPTPERCDYGCTIGKKLRWLETEFSDVTGWSHKNWQNQK